MSLPRQSSSLLRCLIIRSCCVIFSIHWQRVSSVGIVCRSWCYVSKMWNESVAVCDILRPVVSTQEVLKQHDNDRISESAWLRRCWGRCKTFRLERAGDIFHSDFFSSRHRSLSLSFTQTSYTQARRTLKIPFAITSDMTQRCQRWFSFPAPFWYIHNSSWQKLMWCWMQVDGWLILLLFSSHFINRSCPGLQHVTLSIFHHKAFHYLFQHFSFSFSTRQEYRLYIAHAAGFCLTGYPRSDWSAGPNWEQLFLDHIRAQGGNCLLLSFLSSNLRDGFVSTERKWRTSGVHG